MFFGSVHRQAEELWCCTVGYCPLAPLSSLPSAPLGSCIPLHHESTTIPYSHGNEYANIITLIGSYSSLCSQQHRGFWAVNRKAKKLWPVGDQYKIKLYFPFLPWHCSSWVCVARVIMFFCEPPSISLSSNSLLTQVQIKILQHTNPSVCCWSAGKEWWKQKGNMENIFCFQMPSAYGWFCVFHGSSYFNVKFRDLRKIFHSFLANLGRR